MFRMEQLRVWAAACSHIHTDLEFGRCSIAEAIAQSEGCAPDGGPAFDWDMMLHLGDVSGTQAPPTDADGPPVVEQLTSAKKHRIEQIPRVSGHLWRSRSSSFRGRVQGAQAPCRGLGSKRIVNAVGANQKHSKTSTTSIDRAKRQALLLRPHSRPEQAPARAAATKARQRGRVRLRPSARTGRRSPRP